MIDDVQCRLSDCLSTVDHLQEETRQLRRAAAAFEELAERLSHELARARAAAERKTTGESDESIERTSSPPHPEHLSDVRSRPINHVTKRFNSTG
jgi:cell division septum initiation protein DivIVA